MSKKNKQMEAMIVESEPVPNPAIKLWIGLGAIVVLFAGFILTVATIQGGTRAPLKLAPEEMTPAATAKPEPAPWTYDSVTNQHWDPAHKHWHTGHAPNQNDQAATPPDIPNPEPWQYDAASNQFFDPDHNHWHTGTPPAEHAVAPAAAPTKAPEAADVPASEAAPLVVEEAVEPAAEPSAEPAPAP